MATVVANEISGVAPATLGHPLKSPLGRPIVVNEPLTCQLSRLERLLVDLFETRGGENAWLHDEILEDTQRKCLQSDDDYN